FWQDIAIDFSRNRIYIPQKDLKRFGIDSTNLESQNITPEFCALLDELIQRTRTLFHEGYPLLNTVRGRLRFELRLTYLGGLEILNKIPQNNYDIYRRRPTVGKRDLPRLLFKTLLPIFWPSHT
ncbi:MAG: squalene/phytoene synthase family protein, partial [Candidatus Latescibacteria bacterium]|nr:squalene/phytoene synthase family protein [Candidatus Latescibacterota bacterium]